MMKKIWKIVFLVSGLLLAAGIVCAAAGFFMGASFETLMEDDLASHVVSWLSPSSQISAVRAIFGA